MKIWAFIPAGGAGSRMGSAIPKQYLSIRGKEMLRHSIERLAFHDRVAGVVVGVAASDERFANLENCPVQALTVAGPERADTVSAGIDALVDFASDDDWVMVHDAARPLVRRADVDKLIDRARQRPDGALLAIPMTDTVKRADVNGRIEETLDRKLLWRAATPQMFPLRLLRECLHRVRERGETVTDEAGAMEAGGYRPQLVACASDNIKITTPSDLPLAEWLMRQQEDASCA